MCPALPDSFYYIHVDEFPEKLSRIPSIADLTENMALGDRICAQCSEQVCLSSFLRLNSEFAFHHSGFFPKSCLLCCPTIYRSLVQIFPFGWKTQIFLFLSLQLFPQNTMFSDIHHLSILAQGGSTPVPLYFGAAYITSGISTHLGDNFDAPQGFDAAEGAYSDKGINAVWADTTAFDNIRGNGEQEVFSGNVQHTDSTNATTY